MIENLHPEIGRILKARFPKVPAKQGIKAHKGYIRFACPYCGDSAEHTHKKRGTMFEDGMSYHCFDCGKHTSIVSFFQDFGVVPEKLDAVSAVAVYKEGRKRKRGNITYEWDGLEKVLPSIDKVAKHLGWYKDPNNPFIKERMLSHKADFIYFTTNGNPVLAHAYNGMLAGFQIRQGGKAKYLKYTLSMIYRDIMGITPPETEAFAELDMLSHVYGIFEMDTSRPVIVFEGAIDSWCCPNSIALSTVHMETSFIEAVCEPWFFFDNDSDGIKKMGKKLSDGHKVFMWRKFLSEKELPDSINDMNQLVVYCISNGSNAYRDIHKYFTSDMLDSLSISMPKFNPLGF